MRHRVHIVDKFQQHPDRKDNTLVWLAQMVQPQIIPITYIGDPLFPFEVTDNFSAVSGDLSRSNRSTCVLGSAPYWDSHLITYCSSFNSILFTS